MTYRLDSDMTLAYGEATDVLSGLHVAPAINVKWREPDNDYYGEVTKLPSDNISIDTCNDY